MTKRSREILAMILFAAAINLLFVFVHECWQDEAQAWLIARDNNIFSLFDVTSFEGHPCLWFFTLMPFARTGMPYFTLKLISYVFILTVIIIIAIKSPFPNYIKAIFIFSPFCIYGFVTPARVYCLCALFTVLSALLYKDKNKSPFLYGIVLAMLLQTHIMMAGFVVAACFEWLYSAVCELRYDKRITKKFLLQILGMSIPFLSGLFLLYELRDALSSPVVANPESLLIIDRWFVAVCGIVFLVCIIFFWIRKLDFKSGGAFFIFMSTVLWQMYIHFFVYSLHMHKIIMWICIFMWFAWVIYSENTQIYIRGGGCRISLRSRHLLLL